MAASTQADLLGNRYGHLAYRRRVIAHSTGSTATRNVLSQESGAIFRVPTVSTAHFSLPRVSSLALGLTYEFFLSTMADANDINIVSTIDSSAAIHLSGLTTGSSVTTASAIAAFSTLGTHSVRVTAVSTVVWKAEVSLGIAGGTSGVAVLGENIYGGWAAGTTIA